MPRVALLVALVAAPALAATDTFGVGNGHRGPLDLSACTGNAYVNEYTTLTSIAGGGLVLNLSSAANFSAGDLVMVWQPAAMSPATVPSQNQAEFVLTGATGAFELARVTSKTATSLTLAAPLSNLSYTHAQVVLVPEFSGVNVGAACTLAPGSKSANTAQPWDGSTGGIVAFFADDSLGGGITNAVNGVISADGAGFEGVTSQLNNSTSGAICGNLNDNLAVGSGGSFRGESVTSANFPIDVASGFGNIANAGGGGNCQQSAGGGGSNGARGGNGGTGTPPTAGGFGGAPIAWRNINSATDALYPTVTAVVNGSLVTRFSFGGGGGHGQTQRSQGSPGGRGGGVVFIRANHLPGTGAIHANGLAPSPLPGPGADADGQGGGGGGGTIILRLEGALGVPCANIQAHGGAGASTTTTGVGAGGGGGGGRVLIQSTSSCTTPGLAGGSGGTAAGAASGQAGVSGTREVIPNNGAFCADGSAASNSLCAGIDVVLSHCNAAFNTCAECATDTQCTNPVKPKCDIYNGICTCSTTGGCPPADPVCNPGTHVCEATCGGPGGDALCASQFGNNPGDPRFCSSGACVPCTASNSAECPNALPVCTANTCNPCTPSTPASVCGTSHNGLICNPGTGACVQCVSAANCSAPNGCVNNTCGACNGNPSCSGSTAGALCAANGACVQCLDASQCSPGQGCVGGMCAPCSGDPACVGSPVGPHCAAGSCVACRDASDCTGGQGCVNHQCTQCSGDPSCSGSPTGPFCLTGSCSQCRTGADCTAGQGCVANLCGACSGDMSCQGNTAGSRCSSGACAQCSTAADCAAGLGCVSGQCGTCNGDASCTGGAGSHCASGTCSPCASNADCVDPTKPQCAPGMCVPCTDNSGCAGHAQALCELSNATNPALVGTCVACTSSTDCMSPAAPRCDSATDTCVAALDAGVDAGAGDAGSPDAGEPDAGGVDGGETPDAGRVADAGEGTDGGGTADGGPNTDAGENNDAGQNTDAGMMADGGSNMMQTQGCGCGSAEGLFSVLMLALLGHRRRRVDRR